MPQKASQGFFLHRQAQFDHINSQHLNDGVSLSFPLRYLAPQLFSVDCRLVAVTVEGGDASLHQEASDPIHCLHPRRRPWLHVLKNNSETLRFTVASLYVKDVSLLNLTHHYKSIILQKRSHSILRIVS